MKKIDIFFIIPKYILVSWALVSCYASHAKRNLGSWSHDPNISETIEKLDQAPYSVSFDFPNSDSIFHPEMQLISF